MTDPVESVDVERAVTSRSVGVGKVEDNAVRSFQSSRSLQLSGNETEPSSSTTLDLNDSVTTTIPLNELVLLVRSQTSDDDELESLRKSNEALHSKTARYSYIEKKCIGEPLLPQDSFSLLAITRAWCTRSFFLALSVLAVQFLTLGLLLWDSLDGRTTPLGVPANVTMPVRIAEYVAILIAVVSQDDVIQACYQLNKGYNADLFDEAFECTSHKKWMFHLLLRFLEGGLSLFTTFVLIMQQTTVIDLLLNFTALEFVANLDDLAFKLALWGFAGPHIQEDVQRIEDSAYLPMTNEDSGAQADVQKTAVPKTLPLGNKQVYWLRKRLRPIMLLAVLCLLMAGAGYISNQQKDGDYRCSQEVEGLQSIIWSARERCYQMGFVPLIVGIKMEEESIITWGVFNGKEIEELQYYEVHSLDLELSLSDGTKLKGGPYANEKEKTRVLDFCVPYDFCGTFVISDVNGNGLSDTGGYKTIFDDGEVCGFDFGYQARHQIGYFCPNQNARCDTHLNNEQYAYDGGDCCEATCVNTTENTCGYDETETNFIGFPNCTDPSASLNDCTDGDVPFAVEIATNDFPNQTSWNVTDDAGSNILQGGPYNVVWETFVAVICIAATSCVTFHLTDSVGDGIYPPGGYKLYLNGTISASGGGFYGSSATHKIGSCKTTRDCPDGLSSLVVDITTDDYPSETSWYVTNDAGNGILQGGPYGGVEETVVAGARETFVDQACIPVTSCVSFHIADTHGDGISPPGGYKVYLNGMISASGDDFGSNATDLIGNC